MDPEKMLEYAELDHPPYADISLPYAFTLRRDGARLFYFGGSHSGSPDDRQYPLLDEFWNRFVREADLGHAILMVEDGPYPPDKDRETAIRMGSEGGYASFLNREAKLPVICPEPSYSEQARHLLDEFTLEEIAGFFFARGVVQWHRHGKAKPIRTYMFGYLRHLRALPAFDDFDWSMEHFREIHRKATGRSLVPEEDDMFRDAISPLRDGNVFNRVAHRLIRFRDASVLRAIEKYWGAGMDIFIVYGGSHAVVQEPALRAYAGGKRKRTDH